MTLLLLAFMGVPTPHSDVAEVRIVFFGRTGGVSDHVGRNRAHALLGDRFSVRGAGPRSYALDGRVVLDADVATFHAFLGAPPIRREVLVDAQDVLTGPFEVLLEPSADPPRTLRQTKRPSDVRARRPSSRREAVAISEDIDRFRNAEIGWRARAARRVATLPQRPRRGTPVLDWLEPRVPGLARSSGRLVDLVNATGARLRLLELEGVDPGRPVETDPYAWEMRFATRGEVELDGSRTVLLNIGRPLSDGARRVEAVRRLRAERPGTIVVAAGDDIEHFSFLSAGAPDLQRPHTWSSFQRMGLDALAPGRSEAAFGMDALVREARVAEVELLAANLTGAGLAGSRLVHSNGARVLLVGLADPRVAGGSGYGGLGEAALVAPGPAVCAAVSAARERLGARPDVVVVFGALTGRERARMVASCHEIDLLLGDFDDRGFTPEMMTTRVADEALRARERHPLPVLGAGRLRVGVVDLQIAGGRLVRARSRAFPVLAAHPPDPAMARAVQRTRQDAYATAQDVLLPVPGASLDADSWRRMTANTLRERYAAEVAVIPRIPFPWSSTGPVTRLQALANLNVPDRLEVLALDAAQIRRLAGSPALRDLVTSGLEPSKPLVLGRPLEARERYRVVTTDTLREMPAFASILGAGTAEHGEPLRDAVLATLDERRRRGTLNLERLTAPQGAAKTTRWVTDLRGLEVGVGNQINFGTVNQDLRETRATAPEHRSLAARGGLGVRRDSPTLDWVSEARAEFAELNVEGDEALEAADSARLSSELQAHAVPTLAGVPYLSAAYETEFTATDGNARKKRVEGALGALWRGRLLQQVRLATLLGHDFASGAAAPELGVLGVLDARAPLGPLVWWLSSEARYYVPLSTTEDLGAPGLVVKARTGLDVPVVGGLALSVYTDLFTVRGQHRDRRDFSSSAVSGVSLKLDQVFKTVID